MHTTHGLVATETGLRTFCTLASTRDCTLDLSSLCMLVICHVSEAATSVTARGPDLSKYPDQSARGISAPLKRKLAVPKPLTSIGLCCRVKCHGRWPGYSSWPDLHCLEMMDMAGLENQCQTPDMTVPGHVSFATQMQLGKVPHKMWWHELDSPSEVTPD